jgi:hypothetical protein
MRAQVNSMTELRSGVFVSYRRDDSSGHAGRLVDSLTALLGGSFPIFQDVDDIAPGSDFHEEINKALSGCAVALVVIGPNWLHIKDASGGRRLEQPNDMVALEIVEAIGKGLCVIPVLVHEARMPGSDELPERIRKLARLNAFEISDSRWRSDAEQLATAIMKQIRARLPSASADTAIVGTGDGSPLGLAATSTGTGDGGASRSIYLGTAGVVLLVLIGLFVGYVWFGAPAQSDSPPKLKPEIEKRR